MTLIREKKIIAYAKREQNLFILKLATVRAAIEIRSLKPRRIMTITNCSRLTYLVSLNKHIRVWHQKLAHARNAQVIKAFKLTDKINLDTSNSKYNPAKILINSNNSNASDSNFNSKTLTANNLTASNSMLIITAYHENNIDNHDNLDKLCILYIGSKST